MNLRLLPFGVAVTTCSGLIALLFFLPNEPSEVAVINDTAGIRNPSGQATDVRKKALPHSSETGDSGEGKGNVATAVPGNGPSDAETGQPVTLPLDPATAVLTRQWKRFSAIAPEPVQFTKSAFSRLLSSEPGDVVEIPTDPPLTGTVSHNRLHDTGGRGFGVRLRDFPGAQFSIAVEPDGSISGHILQDGNRDSFLVSASASGEQITLRKTETAQVVCSWKRKDGSYRIGHLNVEESEEPEIAPGEFYMVPALESRPGAARVIYLDFDGEVVEGTSWAGGARIDAQPYAHPSRIPGIFQAIAEDFAPFNVNVTTVRASFDNAATGNRCQVIFTPTNTARPGAGGVAFLNSFGSSVNYMCWAFNSGEQVAGETGSHEVGHQLGLRHDGRNFANDDDDEEYFYGHTHGPTGVRWGPIMGAAFGVDISHWSKGEYPNPSNTEDDYLKIIDDLPYLNDDHGGGTTGATNISTNVSLSFAMTGRIGRTGDVDVFRLVLNKAGRVTAQADPTESKYPNLDLRLQLLDSTGSVLNTSSPAGPFDASLSVPNLAVGTYYLRVTGVGLGSTGFAEQGYNNYGSLGNYTLNGTYPFLLIPQPPTGLTATDGSSTENIFVNWNSTADTDGYRLYRSQTNNPAGATQIAELTGTSYTDTAVAYTTPYYYWVKAYNSQGESDFSEGDSGFRRLPQPATPTGLSATDGTSTAYCRVTWNLANFAYEYEVYRNTVNSTNGGTLLTTTAQSSFNDTTGGLGILYYYYVKAINPEGESGFSNVNQGYKRIPPPATPGGLAASDGTSSTETVITWNSVPLASGYYVYRNTVSSSNGALNIGGTDGALSFSDTSGVAGSVYYYFVRAVNDQGFSGFSGSDSGFRLAVPPVAPTGVEGSQGSFASRVRVSWGATAETVDYAIYRNLENSFSGAVRVATQTGVIFYDDRAENGRTYYYFIVARNNVGDSPPSAPAVGYVGTEDDSDDAYENNDTRLNAFSLKSMEDEWLSGEDGDAISNDVDWYEVKTAPEGERIDIIVAHGDVTNSLSVSLHNAQGVEVATGTNGVSAEVVSYDEADPSTSYFLVVKGPVNSGLNYDVFWSSLHPDESGIRIDSSIGGSPGSRIGVGFSNTTAAGQTLNSIGKSRGNRRAFVDVQNESAVGADISTVSSRGNRFFRTTFFEIGSELRENVTASIISTGNVRALIPRETVNYEIRVKPKRSLKPHRVGRNFLPVESSSEISPESDLNRFHVIKSKERKKKKRRR